MSDVWIDEIYKGDINIVWLDISNPKLYIWKRFNPNIGQWIPATPSEAKDIGAESTEDAKIKMDTHASLTNTHGATSTSNPNRIIVRDKNGRAKVAPPADNDDIARKDTVDNAVDSVVDGAPQSLNTLSKLANAFGNDPNFSDEMHGRLGTQEKMWSSVNGSASAKAGESVYLPNDTNLFGYMAPETQTQTGETWLNMITVEQNNIIEVGDYKSEMPLWLMAGTYHSLRAPMNPTYQQIDSTGASTGPGRTLKHQGNSSYHCIVFANSTLTLPVNAYTTLTNLGTINLQFPPSSWDGSGYLIPRNGVYAFNVKLKISQAVPRAGSIRFALYVVHSNGSTTLSDIDDIDYNGMYATPFKGVSFQYALSLGDRVYIQVKPLVDSLTISNGSQLHIYGLGDTIQS